MFISAGVKTKLADSKLQTKLVLAFLLVVATGILVVTGVISYSTKVFFNEYVHQNIGFRAAHWSNSFESYYTKNNRSWKGVQKFLSEQTALQHQGFRRGMMPVERVVLTDNKSVVLADSDGTGLGKKTPRLTRQTEASIEVDGRIVGKVILGMSPPLGVTSLEQRFFESVIGATVLACLIAAIFAVSLAIHFSRRISIPLVSLIEAVKKLTEKDFKYRLFMPSKDEIGTLANAFNTMADAIDKNEQIRNHLIADVAHELRTPITIIRGNLESIQAGVLEPSQEVIVSMHDELLRLSRLINDLQEISLAESGKLLLRCKMTNVNELLRKVVNSFRVSASDKEIEINLKLPEKEYLLDIDEDRVVQVLSNIISNAIRHTPTGEKINISLEEKEENLICFSVTDSGKGINVEDMPYIFERFYRGSRSRNRADGGTGLGLAIAKSLTEAHGGEIMVHCPPIGGSVFTVCLPKSN